VVPRLRWRVATRSYRRTAGDHRKAARPLRRYVKARVRAALLYRATPPPGTRPLWVALLGKAPVECAHGPQAGSSAADAAASEQKHRPLPGRVLAANKAWIEQGLINDRIKRPYDFEIARLRSGGGCKSLADQAAKASVSFGNRLAIRLVKKVSAVARSVHHDVGSHGRRSDHSR